MNAHLYPSLRKLTLIWAILLLLSVGTIFTGQVNESDSIGLIWMACLLGVTFFKTTLILNYFLDLKAATQGWSQFFIILVFLILLIIYGLYAAGILLT